MCWERKCTPTYHVSDFCTINYHRSFLRSCLKAQLLLKFCLLFDWKLWPRGLGFYRDKHVFSSNLFSTNLDCWFHNCSCTSSLLRGSQSTWKPVRNARPFLLCPLTQWMKLRTGVTAITLLSHIHFFPGQHRGHAAAGVTAALPLPHVFMLCWDSLLLPSVALLWSAPN